MHVAVHGGRVNKLRTVAGSVLTPLVCRLRGLLRFSSRYLRCFSQKHLQAQEVKVKYLLHLFLHPSVCLHENFLSIVCFIEKSVIRVYLPFDGNVDSCTWCLFQ